MKTTISIPAAVFRSAECAAKRLKLTRSQLYAAAVSAYLERHRDVGITDKLNEVYADPGISSLEPDLAAVQLHALPLEGW